MEKTQKMKNQFVCGDCLEIVKQIPPRSVDLVFGSPPYEDARTYGIGFNLKGQEWVNWMVEVYKTSLRVCKGLVAFVVQGRTRNYQWSATPALLMADLHRAGICLRNPPLYQRSGVPGSGGPDWLRGDYEWIICATNGGKLSWSDNVAMGHIPRWGPGGPMSNRKQDGSRVNQWGGTGKQTERMKDGSLQHRDKPSHVYLDPKNLPKNYVPPTKANPGNIIKRHANELPEQGMRYPNGKRRKHGYTLDQIEIANPGNMINCGASGRGHLGSLLAHENEAPFAEYLAEFFIRSFCPSGGWVLDPFSGSGTTCAVAEKTGRIWTGIDIRQNQIELGQKRILEIKNATRKICTI